MSNYADRVSRRRNDRPPSSRSHETPPPWLFSVFNPNGFQTVAEKEMEMIDFAKRDALARAHMEALDEDRAFNLALYGEEEVPAWARRQRKGGGSKSKRPNPRERAPRSTTEARAKQLTQAAIDAAFA